MVRNAVCRGALAKPANHKAARRARRSAGPADHRYVVSGMARRALAQLRCELTERIITEAAWLCCSAKQPETIAAQSARDARVRPLVAPASIESFGGKPILFQQATARRDADFNGPSVIHGNCLAARRASPNGPPHRRFTYRRRPVRPARDAERRSRAIGQPIRKPVGATRMPGTVRNRPAHRGGLFHALFPAREPFRVNTGLVAADRLCYTPPRLHGTIAARRLLSILPILAVVQWIERAPPKR